MKFLTKINRQYFLTYSILLVFVSVIGYFLLRLIIIYEVKEDILEKEYAIIQEIRNNNNLPNIYPIIKTKKINENEMRSASYKKIFFYNEIEQEQEAYLEYTNTLKINNSFYCIKLRHSLLESNDLIMAISLSLLLLLVLALIVSFVITKQMNKTVWNVFEVNLKKIENFSFNKSFELELTETDIDEFNTLNKTLLELTKKLKSDYKSLKEFTENASHEIQTPLTIISLTLDEVLQQDLSESVFKQVISTQKAIKRLSNLNERLLLLTKIENMQYPVDEQININDVIDEQVKEFTALIKHKNIDVSFIISGTFKVKINYILAEILFNNLISNAIKHNIDNGKLNIIMTDEKISICNTGKNNSLTNSSIFHRFTKENSQSYGLGLSIVKQICDTHKLDIKYIKDKLHCFTIIRIK